MLRRLEILPLIMAALCFSPRASADDAAANDSFENEIRPLLAAHCFECHGNLDQPKGGLRVTSRAALLSGGETGPAAVPGKPADSLFVEAIRYQGLKMPPKAKLSEAEIGKLVHWVEMGLPWPGADDSPPPAASPDAEFTISAAQRAFWSWQPLANPPLPTAQDAAWPLTPLDHFILAGLESQGLRPNPPADKRTLLRRATFDLTGLPPTPSEVATFLADDSPDAFARVIDRLLASPAYGRALGAALARCRALCRHRRRDRRLPGAASVSISQLRDLRLQHRQAVQRVHSRAGRRRHPGRGWTARGLRPAQSRPPATWPFRAASASTRRIITT